MEGLIFGILRHLDRQSTEAIIHAFETIQLQLTVMRFYMDYLKFS